MTPDCGDKVISDTRDSTGQLDKSDGILYNY